MKKLLLLLLLLPSLASAGDTIFYFNSTPGDYIGAGKEVIITPETPMDFNNYGRDPVRVRIYLNNYNYAVPGSYLSYYTDFAAPYDQPLQVGSYENATRAPFKKLEEPGMSVTGNGRGCNKILGRFDVLEIERDDDGYMVKFAVDYEQSCEGTNPPLFGSIRYNSDVPISTLLPGKIEYLSEQNSDNCVEATGPEGGMIDLIGIPYQKGNSLTWSTSTGVEGSGSTISFPLGLDAVETVTLTTSDAGGNLRSTVQSVCVSDTTPPTIRIIRPKLAETYVGNNLKLEAEVTDVVDVELSDYFTFVGNYFNGELTDGYASQKLAKPDDGLALVRVVATDASGNTAQTSVTVYLEHDNSK